MIKKSTNPPSLENEKLIRDFLQKGEVDELGKFLSALQPEDVAECLLDFDPETGQEVFQHLSLKAAGEVLDEVAPSVRPRLVRKLSPALLVHILETMPPEEAAEVISDMEPGEIPRILRRLPREDSTEIQQILTYPENSAGRIMDCDLISVEQETTIARAIEQIKKSTIEETLYSVFVVDSDNRLKGIIPLRKVLTAPPKVILRQIMRPPTATVTPETDQEKAAYLVKKYDLPVLAVVDEKKRLLGRITPEEVMDILDEEASEDIYRMAGTDEEELRATSSFRIAQIRLPWLMICIGGSFLSGLVIRSFEVTLARVISLVAFIPMITATGGNVGLQSSSIVIRGLALGILKPSHLWREVIKQIKVALWLGITCGALLAAVTVIWREDPFLGAVVGLSMFLAVSFSTLSGVIIPLIFNKLKVDPAIASGPLITTLNDVLGIALYLATATLMIKYLL